MTHEEKKAHEALVRQMSQKVVGGTTQMQLSLTPDDASLENPAHWLVMRVQVTSFAKLDLQGDHWRGWCLFNL
jgi:hypothetical protein